MRTITESEFQNEFLIYKELSNNNNCRTYTAMKDDPNGTPRIFVLKEMNEKRAAVYEELSKIWSPYVSQVYEVLKVDNKYIAVTEYVCTHNSIQETMTLTEYIEKDNTFDQSTALSVCIQICSGLEEFHKRGFVHRDLKPDNIMIADDSKDIPKIKIIDFGGAKTANILMTPDTTVIGTLGYQAPETISSAATGASDIYSIGCILSFMLTGQELGFTHYKKNHYIAAIIEKAANDDPSHRYSSVASMKKALEHELSIRLSDRIPIVRAMPGFRTHTGWKEFLAIFGYVSMIFICVIAYDKFGIGGLLELFGFYFIVPLIFIFNMGNLLRFVPNTIRGNNRRFMIFRTAALLLSLFAPIFVDSIIGRA